MSEAFTARTAVAEIELAGKGLTESEARDAVRQASRWSTRMAAKVRPELRDAVALDLLEGRLRDVETDYIAGRRAVDVEAAGAAYAERAAASGFPVGPETQRRYVEGMAKVAE